MSDLSMYLPSRHFPKDTPTDLAGVEFDLRVASLLLSTYAHAEYEDARPKRLWWQPTAKPPISTPLQILAHTVAQRLFSIAASDVLQPSGDNKNQHDQQY